LNLYIFKMSTIILGHSGFVGKHIYDNLKKNKINPIGGNTKNCNLLKKTQTEKFFKGKNKFNLIICSSLVRSKKDNQKSFNQNILMISNLLNVIDEKNVNKIIFLSSIDTYKPTKSKLKENTSPTIPETKYGLYKLTAEYLLKNKFPSKKLIILRLTGVYDDNINGINMVSYIRRGIKKSFLDINSSGKELRDYIHAEDVAHVVHFFLLNNFSGIYNVATGTSKSVQFYVEKIKKMNFSNKVKINYFLKNNLNDININISKLKKIFSLSKSINSNSIKF
tara:strand:+ start:756 stop:1592 length:837 start_codon:yes stop_codon:yes gene_type:complete